MKAVSLLNTAAGRGFFAGVQGDKNAKSVTFCYPHSAASGRYGGGVLPASPGQNANGCWSLSVRADGAGAARGKWGGWAGGCIGLERVCPSPVRKRTLCGYKWALAV